VELTESDRDFRARIALPGFNEKDLKVTAAPEALIVEAKNTHTHDEAKDGVLLCEFSGKRLFRRLELPAQINVDKVTATLDRGILLVHAPKTAQPKQVKSAAAQ
jgi:HSP20 family protein